MLLNVILGWGPNQICIDNGFDFFSPLLNLPSTTTQLDKPRYGFLWINGYLSGIFIGWLSTTKFQVFKGDRDENDIQYRSIWLRSDTWPLFFMELFTILFEYLPRIFKQFLRIK
jgi:hypothetical protein